MEIIDDGLSMVEIIRGVDFHVGELTCNRYTRVVLISQRGTSSDE